MNIKGICYNTGRTHFKKGHKESQSTKEKRSKALMGNKNASGKIPWNKGKSLGFVPKMAFKKGNFPWNKGKKGVQKNLNMDGLKLGRAWNKGKYGLFAGEKASNWQGGITPKNKLERIVFVNRYRKIIFERDNYTCQFCGQRGGRLQIDHIQPWAKYVEGRFCLDNCRTLCQECHYKITYGKPMSKESVKWGNVKKEGGIYACRF